jgi:hypothetical protein
MPDLLSRYSIDLYQTHLVCDRWIFEPLGDGFDEVAPNCWIQKVECYKSIYVNRQRYLLFIGILS